MARSNDPTSDIPVQNGTLVAPTGGVTLCALSPAAPDRRRRAATRRNDFMGLVLCCHGPPEGGHYVPKCVERSLPLLGSTLGRHQRDDGRTIEGEVALEHVLEHLRSHGVNPVVSSQNLRGIAAEQMRRSESPQPVSVLFQRGLVTAARRLLGTVGQIRG